MRLIDKARMKSPWVLHYNSGSCNGCDIEILSCLTPMYDLERFGIVNVGNPKHADVLLVTGPVTHRGARVLRNLYEQMPSPKAVVAVGTCAWPRGACVSSPLPASITASNSKCTTTSTTIWS
jgi:ech hydrogenase subunit C